MPRAWDSWCPIGPGAAGESCQVDLDKCSLSRGTLQPIGPNCEPGFCFISGKMIARGGSGRSCFGWKASAWPGELRPWSPRDLSGSCCPPWPCRRGGGEYAGADCCLRKMLVSSFGTPFTFASCFAACGSGEDDCGLGVNSEDDFGLRRVFSILSGFDSVRSKGFFAFALCSLAGSTSTVFVLVFFFFLECS